MGYNTAYSIESQLTFWRNMLPPSSGSRITQAGIDFKETCDSFMREVL
jgi:hypothetical protein